MPKERRIGSIAQLLPENERFSFDLTGLFWGFFVNYTIETYM